MSKGPIWIVEFFSSILFYSVTRTKVLIMHSVFSNLGSGIIYTNHVKKLTEVVFSLFYCVKIV